MTNRKKIILAKQYLKLAKALYHEGFLSEALEIVSDVRLAMAAGLISSKSNGNFRYAIRGRSTWEDYLQETIIGAGSGAAAGAATGATTAAGIGAVPGAIIGAGLGAASGLVAKGLSELWYKAKGGVAQAKAQAEDFVTNAEKSAKILEKSNRHDLSQKLMFVAQQVKNRVDLLAKYKHQELRKMYGVNPNKNFWQNLVSPTTWTKSLGRWGHETFYASQKPQMVRSAASEGEAYGDVAVWPSTLKGLGRRLFHKSPNPAQVVNLAGKTGLRSILNPMNLVGGAVAIGAGIGGAYVTEKAYGGIENLIRGKEGLINYYANEMNAIGQEISKALNDPQFAKAGQDAARILQQAL